MNQKKAQSQHAAQHTMKVLFRAVTLHDPKMRILLKIVLHVCNDLFIPIGLRNEQLFMLFIIFYYIFY